MDAKETRQLNDSLLFSIAIDTATNVIWANGDLSDAKKFELDKAIHAQGKEVLAGILKREEEIEGINSQPC